jgi:hypothetical protein
VGNGAPFGTGFREPSPSVSALTGFNPSQWRSRTFANAIDHLEAMDEAFGAMLEHGLHGGPEYDLARDRFNALKDNVRDQARAAS